MIELRMIRTSGEMLVKRYETVEDATIQARVFARTGGRALVLQRMRGGWHVIYDSELGY